MSFAFNLSDLAAAARLTTSVSEAHAPYSGRAAVRTAFLCHSHLDRVYALGFKHLLASQGVTLYIDWLDEEMPAKPDRATAEKIRRKIADCDLFLFLATPNSMSSRWCPWELGVADGRKADEKIAIVPTRDSAGNYYGNEYLLLYRRIELAEVSRFGRVLAEARLFEPNSSSGMEI